MNGRAYQRRSSYNEDMERDDNYLPSASDDVDEQSKSDQPPPPREDQYIAALRHRFPSRPKTDYAYSKPLGHLNPSTESPTAHSTTTPPRTTATAATNTTGPRNGGYQSSVRPPIGSANASDVSDERGLPRPALRRVTPDQQNTYARRINSETQTQTPPSSQTRPTGPGSGPNVRIDDQHIDTNRPTTSNYPRQPGLPKTQESIFEKVHSPGGTVSYLGTGTFSQFEHCLRECLERERRQTGVTSHITRHDIPPNISVNDFGYDATVVSPPIARQGLHPSYSHSSMDYPSRYHPEFSLDDIRCINVALSRQGVPLLPYDRPLCDRDSHTYSLTTVSPVTTLRSNYSTGTCMPGEVVSACRLVEEDPAILCGRNPNRTVQNAGNVMHNNRSFFSS